MGPVRGRDFHLLEKEYQHLYVGKHLQDKVISVLELVQTHHNAAIWPHGIVDILMLKTLHALK